MLGRKPGGENHERMLARRRVRELRAARRVFVVELRLDSHRREQREHGLSAHAGAEHRDWFREHGLKEGGRAERHDGD